MDWSKNKPEQHPGTGNMDTRSFMEEVDCQMLGFLYWSLLMTSFIFWKLEHSSILKIRKGTLTAHFCGGWWESMCQALLFLPGVLCQLGKMTFLGLILGEISPGKPGCSPVTPGHPSVGAGCLLPAQHPVPGALQQEVPVRGHPHKKCTQTLWSIISNAVY